MSGALNLIYQYWVHTQLIGKLGWYESVFVTPSHHRVHHAQNQIYIDKNHGGVFILWDKLFGTYQEELDEHQVIYGVRRPVKSYNPIWSNVHTWFSLLSDAVRTKSWWDKIRIWFMPTGWRPADVEAKYPLVKQAAGEQIKYSPKSSKQLKFYALFQYMACIIFGVLFVQFSIQLDNILQLFFWVLVTLPLLTNGFALEGRTDLLIFSEVTRLLLTSIIVFSNQESLSELLNTMILVYLALSVIAMIAVSRKKKDKKIPLTS